MSDLAITERQADENSTALMRRATDVAGICRAVVVKMAVSIKGKKYVPVEAWCTIANAYNCIPSIREVIVEDGGVRAICDLKRADGSVVASAEGFVGNDEPTWASRAMYARRAMAQTRSISRVCRTAYAFVVALMDAGLSTTPLEEMDFEQKPVKAFVETLQRVTTPTPAKVAPKEVQAVDVAFRTTDAFEPPHGDGWEDPDTGEVAEEPAEDLRMPAAVKKHAGKLLSELSTGDLRFWAEAFGRARKTRQSPDGRTRMRSFRRGAVLSLRGGDERRAHRRLQVSRLLGRVRPGDHWALHRLTRLPLLHSPGRRAVLHQHGRGLPAPRAPRARSAFTASTRRACSTRGPQHRAGQRLTPRATGRPKRRLPVTQPWSPSGPAGAAMQLRPSALPVIMKCPQAARLPAVEELSDGMSAGTARHLKLAKDPEKGIRVFREAGFPISEKPALVGSEVWLDYLGVEGRTDLVIQDEGRLYVLDWKGRADWIPANESAQLKFYALAAARNFEVEDAVIALVHVDDDCNVLGSSVMAFDKPDILDFETELRKVLVAIDENTGTLTLGEHCARCRSSRFCPAQSGVVADLALVPRAAAITDATISAAWVRLKQFKIALEQAEDAVRVMAAQQPVDLGGGRTLGLCETSRETIDTAKAVDVLAAKYGAHAVAQLVEKKITKGRVLSVLGEEALVALRVAGASRTELSSTVREHKRAP